MSMLNSGHGNSLLLGIFLQNIKNVNETLNFEPFKTSLDNLKKVSTMSKISSMRTMMYLPERCDLCNMAVLLVVPLASFL